MRTPGPPIAVLSSDWHLSHDKPFGRAGTREDWYRTMERHVMETMGAAASMKVPLIVAGDVFHTWNEPVELVNAAAEWIGCFSTVPVLVIPGQHDLPYHDPEQFERSALRTLQTSANGVHREMAGGGANLFRIVRGWSVFRGFPPDWSLFASWWGDPLQPPLSRPEKRRALLVAHRYVWAGGGTGHVKADQSDSVVAGDALRKTVESFDACLFGDNHHPFLAGNVYNHGCMIRRTLAERTVTPQYGVLFANGSIDAFPLDSPSRDKWNDGEDEHKPVFKMAAGQTALLDATHTQFVDSVRQLATDQSVDMTAAINRLLGESRLSKAARREILELLQ